MITENYTSRVRRNDDQTVHERRIEALERNLEMLSQNNRLLRQERTIMAVKILHLELMLTDKDYRKKFKKQNKSK